MKAFPRILFIVASLLWFVAVSWPAWLLYIATLGAVSLDFFFNGRPNMIEITVPGWSKNTFSYGLPKWRPF